MEEEEEEEEEETHTMISRGQENYFSLSQTDLALILEVYTHRPQDRL